MWGGPFRNRARKSLIVVRNLARQHWVEVVVVGAIGAVIWGLVWEYGQFVRARNVENQNRKGMDYARTTIAVIGTEQSDLGSGVFINTGGVFITNNHILDGIDFSKIWVTLPNGKRYESPSRICANARYDVAVLKFSEQGLQDIPVARPGDSDSVRDGQPVVVAYERWGTSPGMEPGGYIMYPPTWSPEADPVLAIKLIQFSAKAIPGFLLSTNGSLLGIVAIPDDIPKRMSQTTNLAVPINVFRPFFENPGTPKGLTVAADAADVASRQRKLCRSLNPDYLQSFELEMTAEAQAIAASQNKHYDKAIDPYKAAIKHLRRIASARITTSPERTLQSNAQGAESAAAAEAGKGNFPAAIEHYKQAIEMLKLIAFPSTVASPDGNGTMKGK